MKPVKLLVLLGLAAFGLSGCYRYACPAPEGTTCKSISQIYKENDAGTLGKKAKKDAHQERKKGAIAREISAPAPPASSADNPRKGEFEEEIKVSAPLVLPIKIYRYIDSDGDLHHPGFVFVMINTPGWGNSDNPEQIFGPGFDTGAAGRTK
jgi:hypothetical protein